MPPLAKIVMMEDKNLISPLMDDLLDRRFEPSDMGFEECDHLKAIMRRISKNESEKVSSPC